MADMKTYLHNVGLLDQPFLEVLQTRLPNCERLLLRESARLSLLSDILHLEEGREVVEHLLLLSQPLVLRVLLQSETQFVHLLVPQRVPQRETELDVGLLALAKREDRNHLLLRLSDRLFRLDLLGHQVQKHVVDGDIGLLFRVGGYLRVKWKDIGVLKLINTSASIHPD